MVETIGSKWFRIPSPIPDVKAYQHEVKDGHLTVLVGRFPANPDRTLCWHLSISHRRNLAGPDGNILPGRIPTWEEIKDARYRFIPNDFNMAMMLPPKEDYVNLHPTTMHLWEIPKDYAK